MFLPSDEGGLDDYLEPFRFKDSTAALYQCKAVELDKTI